MTKEDLKETKVFLSNKENRSLFFKKVFELEVRCASGTTKVINEGVCYYIDEHYILRGSPIKNFQKDRERQVSLQDVLNIK